MPVRTDILAILACPKCKGMVQYQEAAGRIVCKSCALWFPVEGDVPVMLVERAEHII